MKPRTKKERQLEKEVLQIQHKAIVGLVIMLVVALIAIVSLHLVQRSALEQQKELALQNAEYNCLQFLCENNGGCPTIDVVNYVQALCKSTVRNTDFYIKNYNSFGAR